MSDFKSKLPDFKEVTSMANKLFKDVKTSVCEIIEDYKKNRAEEAAKTKETEVYASKKTTPKETVEVTTVKTRQQETEEEPTTVKKTTKKQTSAKSSDSEVK